MSLHQLNGSPQNSSRKRYQSRNDVELDDESLSCSPNELRKELEWTTTELNKAKKELKELNDALLQADDSKATMKTIVDESAKNLRKATARINELATLCDEKEGENAELKASLGMAQRTAEKLRTATSKISELETLCDEKERENADLQASLEAARRSAQHSNELLELAEGKCTRLALEKSLLEDKIVDLEGKIRSTARNEDELFEALNQSRTDNVRLKRELLAAREREHISSSGCVDEDDSPERMVFEPFELEPRDGTSLRDELDVLLSPLVPTTSRGFQFPSSNDVREALEDTEQEILLGSSPPDADPIRTNGGVANASHCCCPIEDSLNATTQTWYSFSSISSSSSKTWWIWFLAFMFFVIAYARNGGKIDVTPVGNFIGNGQKVRYRNGFPPH